MCTREDVQIIIDKAQEHNDAQFEKIREERDSRVIEIVKAEISREKSRFLQFVGFGGLITIGGLFYFFGQQNTNLEGIVRDIADLSKQMEKVETFMASGDRFTTTDGIDLRTELREYSDSKDELIIQRVESGFENLSKQIDDQGI